MAEWKKMTVGDLCDTISETYHGNDEEVVLINTSDVLEGKVLNHQVVENKNLKGQFKKTFKKNDILYSEIRPANKRYAFVDFGDTENYIASTKLMVLRPREDVVRPLFLFYFLSSKSVLDDLQQLAETRSGTFPQITFSSELASIPIDVPDLETQNRIVSILAVIEKKIRTNERINNNLEEQAQLLFTDRFVANNYTVAQEAKIGDICKCILGGTPSRAKAEYWGGTVPWINSGEINRFRIISPSELITQSGLDHSATKILPAKTTVLAITGATLGQVSLLEIDACANQSVVGIIPNDTLPYEFIYPFIKAKINELISHQTGGAQQHINKQNVESLPVSIPTRDILYDFLTLVSPMYSMIASNCFENMRLENMRDSLLPQLMSGELDVSDIDL